MSISVPFISFIYVFINLFQFEFLVITKANILTSETKVIKYLYNLKGEETGREG